MDRFVRWCTRTAGVLALTGLASLVVPGGSALLGVCALVLAAMLGVMVGLVVVIRAEEREHALWVDPAPPSLPVAPEPIQVAPPEPIPLPLPPAPRVLGPVVGLPMAEHPPPAVR